MSIYGPRGAMLGSGSFLDGYEVGSKRPRMMESNPYFAVSGGAGGYHPSSFVSSFGGAATAYHFPVVKLRGLPFNCSDLDVFRFFSGLDVVDCLLTHKGGRFSGEAFVVFAFPVHAELALQRDRHNMGRRYVEVFRCKKLDYYNAIAAELSTDNHRGGAAAAVSPPAAAAAAKEQKAAEVNSGILKLRGLPFSATAADIVDFFGGFDLAEEDVHVAHRADGKATGEAFVEFSSAEEAKRAMMAKDRLTIGSRYVEIFPSSSEEAQRAKSRSRT